MHISNYLTATAWLKLSAKYCCTNFVAEYIKQLQIHFFDNMIITLDVVQVVPRHTQGFL